MFSCGLKILVKEKRNFKSMSFFIIAASSLIIVFLTAAAGFVAKGLSNPGKVFLFYPLFCFSDIIKADGFYNYLLIKIFLSIYIFSVCCFFSSSNHFIISLDIIFMFSLLIPVMYNNLKISKSLNAR